MSRCEYSVSDTWNTHRCGSPEGHSAGHRYVLGVPAHTERAWYGCVTCWAKIPPGPRARVIVDVLPATATTTGGV